MAPSSCTKLVELLLFQKALASYIKKYAYSNAKTEDLWAVLEEVSGEPVKNLMTTWTKKQGYPVIGAKLKGHDVELEQVMNYRKEYDHSMDYIHLHANHPIRKFIMHI